MSKRFARGNKALRDAIGFYEDLPSAAGAQKSRAEKVGG